MMCNGMTYLRLANDEFGACVQCDDYPFKRYYRGDVFEAFKRFHRRMDRMPIELRDGRILPISEVIADTLDDIDANDTTLLFVNASNHYHSDAYAHMMLCITHLHMCELIIGVLLGKDHPVSTSDTNRIWSALELYTGGMDEDMKDARTYGSLEENVAVAYRSYIGNIFSGLEQ